MLIEKDDRSKFIDIWLKKEEESPDLNKLHQRFPGYFITVWHSGDRDLGQLTAELLRTNLETGLAADA